MRNLLLTCVMALVTAAALTGCRAEVEVDPDGSVSYNPAQSRLESVRRAPG